MLEPKLEFRCMVPSFLTHLSRLKSARQVKTLSAVSTFFSGSIATKVPNVARVTMMDTL